MGSADKTKSDLEKYTIGPSASMAKAEFDPPVHARYISH